MVSILDLSRCLSSMMGRAVKAESMATSNPCEARVLELAEMSWAKGKGSLVWQRTWESIVVYELSVGYNLKVGRYM